MISYASKIMWELRTDLLSPGFVESRGVELAFAGLFSKASNPHRCHYICVHCAVRLRARIGKWKAGSESPSDER
jgi:hypothetical protein